MAQIIPRVNPADITPVNDLPTARLTTEVPDNAEAFLAAGRVLNQGLGLVRDQLKQRQALEDNAVLMNARRQLSDWEHETWDPQNAKGIHAYRGQRALAADSDLLPQLDTRVAAIRQNLRGDQQLRFDEMVLGFRESIRNRLDGWMTREHDAFTAGERKAFVDNLTNDAIRAGVDGDFGLAGSRAQELLLAQSSDLALQGAGPEAIKAFQRGAASSIYSSIAKGMALQDPMRAVDFLARYENQLDEGDKMEVRQVLRPYIEDAQGDADAAAILSGQGLPPDVTFDAPAAPREGLRGGMVPEDVQHDLQAIAGAHGATITSMVRPIIAKGAGARSQHPKGTAADFRTKDKTDGEVRALMADLRAAGFEVIDERDGPEPHIHAELPPDGRRPGPTLGGMPVAAGGTGDGVQYQSVRSRPPTDAEMLARAQAIPDPRRRRVAEAKVRDAIQVRTLAQADAEKAAAERLNLAVETADPSTPLRSILGADFETAARKGWIDNFEQRLRERRAGTATVSSPDVVESLDTIIYQATVQGKPQALEYLRTLNVYDPKLKLDAGDRKRIAGVQLAIGKGDSQGMAAAASDAEITQTISQYGMQLVGAENAKQLTGAKRAQFNEFNQAMRLFVSEYSEANKGKKPSYREIVQHADELTIAGKTFDIKVPGRFFGTNTETVAVRDLNIPPPVQSMLIARLRGAGVPVTGANIAQAYKNYQKGAR